MSSQKDLEDHKDRSRVPPSIPPSYEIAVNINIAVTDCLPASVAVFCSPAVQRLKEYVEVNIGPISTPVVPMFTPRGSDQAVLSYLAQFCLLGLLQRNMHLTRRNNLLVAYCIANGMLGAELVTSFLSKFAENHYAPGVSDAIKVVCQQCKIDPQLYPELREGTCKLEKLWDSFEKGAQMKPKITYQW